MKKAIMMTIVAVSLSFSAMAQENNPQRGRSFDPAEMAQRRTEMMAQRYGLDENQKTKLLDLNKQYSDVMMPMMGRPGGPRGGMNNGQRRPQGPPPAMQGDNKAPEGQAKEGVSNGEQRPPRPGRGPGFNRPDPEKMQKYEAGLKEILTEEQYSKYQADQKARMERMSQRGPRGNRDNQQ